MEKLIIIKYGELTTKKGNISFFINLLKRNIKENLKNINHSIISDRGRMFIYTNNHEEVINKLTKIFGIHEINVGYELYDNNFEHIKEKVIELLKEKKIKTFKVETKRSEKKYSLDSMEVNRKLGSAILDEHKESKVDVHNPELLINIEIRQNNKVYIYFDKIKGMGGYPVGVQGKGMLMLSGGIDSPVAGFYALKRGVKLSAIYFESPPHTSESAKNKVLDLAKVLTKYGGDINVHVVNFTKIQEAIYKEIPHDYMITIMRRMMYRISEEVSKNINARALFNGESIGQVASQTLTSMSVINEVVKMPVIRPLSCFDKIDIVNVSKEIGAYEISILPYEDCCTIFVPDHPVINPVSSKAYKYEKYIPYEEMIKEAIQNIEVIKISSNDTKFESIL